LEAAQNHWLKKKLLHLLTLCCPGKNAVIAFFYCVIAGSNEGKRFERKPNS
jgi:hypothetical protein